MWAGLLSYPVPLLGLVMTGLVPFVGYLGFAMACESAGSRAARGEVPGVAIVAGVLHLSALATWCALALGTGGFLLALLGQLIQF